jgi:hypothetical protein
MKKRRIVQMGEITGGRSDYDSMLIGNFGGFTTYRSSRIISKSCEAVKSNWSCHCTEFGIIYEGMPSGSTNDNGKHRVKTGNFRTNSQLVAHAFSIFNLPYIDAANMANYKKIELEILLMKGDGIPKEIAKKLPENKAKCPETTHHLCYQFYNWYGMLQICFGKEALIMKETRAWLDHVDRFELSYNARFKTDPDFGAKVLGLVDLMFFQFCNSCLKAESLDDVNFGSIMLDNDCYAITRNNFQACMPAYLALQQN